MLEHIGWGLLLNTRKIGLRLHKYGFVLLNRQRIAANTIFRNQKTTNYSKRSNEGFPSKHLCNTLFHYYIQMVELQIRFPSHTLLTEVGILILSSLAQKLQSKKG